MVTSEDTARDVRLSRAMEHIFLSGAGDVAEQLCLHNMTYGLAKIHHVEALCGLCPRAFFIGAPDATVTRNPYRWRQGFGYGGAVYWDERLVILDSKPNGCGMLVGSIPSEVDEHTIRRTARQISQATLSLDQIPLTYDLGESNHFIDILQLDHAYPGADTLPEHIFIIHSSGHEHRRRSPWGPGLYIDQSAELQAMAERVETPWGPLAILRDEAAQTYYRFVRAVQRFNERRREFYAERLFGPFTPICNVTHQGFRAPGQLHLGSYWCEPDQLYPLTLGPDQPAFLIRPRPNFSHRALELLGWRERAQRLGLMPRLLNANILPHGGGYSFPGIRRIVRVRHAGDRRRFTLQGATGEPLEMEEIRDLPFGYRDRKVLDRLITLELGDPIAQYRIRFVIKDEERGA